MILLEQFVPGCCVAFSDISRALFDEIVAGYFGEGHTGAAGHFQTDALQLRPSFRDLPYYEDPDEMLDTEDINTVVISSYCSSHAEMVRKCVKRGMNIFLEKPIAITEADVEEVWQLLRDYPQVATVNFTMRGAPVTVSAYNHVRRGDLGKVVSVQYVNNVHYGDGYFRKWMRTRKNVGDLFLQKATHDFDIINHVIGLKPVSIAAFGSRLVYGGDMPNDLTCDTCEKKMACPMSVHRRHLDAAKALYPRHMRKCVYAQEIDIDDNQVVIIQYEGGVTASYSQTFNAPAQGGKRGGFFIGTEGIMELQYYGEFVEAPSGETLVGNSHLDLRRHNGKPGSVIHEVHDWAGHGHFDGTEYVMESKLHLLAGRPTTIAGTMEEGYISAKMCLAAQKSIETGQVVPLDLDLINSKHGMLA
jgi:predicted dehydrogenase